MGMLRTAPSSRFVPPSPAGFDDSMTTVPGREASAESFDEPPPRHPPGGHTRGRLRTGQALRLLTGVRTTGLLCPGYCTPAAQLPLHGAWADMRASLRQDGEALLGEAQVERETATHVEAAHHLEAGAVHEAQSSPVGEEECLRGARDRLERPSPRSPVRGPRATGGAPPPPPDVSGPLRRPRARRSCSSTPACRPQRPPARCEPRPAPSHRRHRAAR
jgi:hypothetical protein